MFEESIFTIHSIWASMNSWFTPSILFLLLNVVIGTIAFTSTLANKKKHQDSPADLQQQQQQQKFVIRSPSLLQRLKSINLSGYRSHESPSVNLYSKRSSDSDSLFSFERSSQSQSFEMQSQYINSSQNQEMQQGHYYPSEITHGKLESVVYQETYQQKNQAQKIKTQENADRQPENVGTGEEIQKVEEVYSNVNEVHVTRSMSDTMPSAGEIPKKLPAKLKKSASLKSAFKHFEEEDILEARRPATVKERRISKVADVDEGVDAKADDFINKFKQQLKLQRLDSIIRYKEMVSRGSGE